MRDSAAEAKKKDCSARVPTDTDDVQPLRSSRLKVNMIWDERRRAVKRTVDRPRTSTESFK